MVAVGRDGSGADIDGDDLRQFTQTGDNPLLAMFVVLAGMRILAAENGTAQATADAVIVGWW
jgi:hypothetical protein